MHLSPTNKRIPVVIAISALILLAGVALEAGRGRFAIESPLEPVLAPHFHAEGESEADEGHGVYLYSSATTTEDMRVSDMRVTIHNAPLSILHHVVVFALGAEDPECPGIPLETDFAAFSQEAPTSVTFPKPYGMFIPKGTVLHMMTMLHNPENADGSGTTYRNVKVSVAFSYAKNEDRNKNVELLRVTLLDAPYCSLEPKGPAFAVPARTERFVRDPNPTGKDRGRLAFPESGTIISAFGHMHPDDGGKEVSLFLNGARMETWRARKLEAPDSSGRIWETPLTPLTIHVNKGDEASVEAVYTNPTNEPERDVMGTVRMFFTPDL